jgi:hypothetical protein
MEALACGCQVFSSINGGLSDYLDPAFNCYKIAGYSLEYDLQRIIKILDSPVHLTLSNQVLSEYRAESIIARLSVILSEINHFFDHQSYQLSTIPQLTKFRLATLLMKKVYGKFIHRYFNFPKSK